jgi:RNA polymerase sigma-70 factor (ECF subfamily)
MKKLVIENSASQKSNLEKLITEFRNGDQKSYRTFLIEISKIVKVVVGKKIAKNDVEDVVQEILISVHKSLHTYNLDRPFFPWLYAICCFRINDFLRKFYLQQSHKTLDIDDVIDFLQDVTNDPSNSELINEIFLTIDKKHQHILTMVYLEGFTFKEAGEKINMSESAIKVAAHRIVKKIKEKFVKNALS